MAWNDLKDNEVIKKDDLRDGLIDLCETYDPNIPTLQLTNIVEWSMDPSNPLILFCNLTGINESNSEFRGASGFIHTMRGGIDASIVKDKIFFEYSRAYTGFHFSLFSFCNTMKNTLFENFGTCVYKGETYAFWQSKVVSGSRYSLKIRHYSNGKNIPTKLVYDNEISAKKILVHNNRISDSNFIIN